MKCVVISLGGSLLVPDKIDAVFLKRFKQLLEKFKSTHQFILVCGGGATARAYDKAARSITNISIFDRDWIGVHATWLNSQLVKSVFKNSEILHIKDFVSSLPIVLITDKVSGTTSDGVAVSTALKYKTKEVVNLTNVGYVYTKDPNKYDDAKPLRLLFWNDYFKIIPKKRTPHMHVPFDPSAALLAAKHKMSVVNINGHHLVEFKKYLQSKKFKGTIIK